MRLPLPLGRAFCSAAATQERPSLVVDGKRYLRDEYTNVTPKILSHIGRGLHNRGSHPLAFLKRRIVDHFYGSFVGRKGNPVFSVYDRIGPVVRVEQNFDSLLIPKDHPSRSKSDCYYINRDYMLRAHTTAHQSDLIRMGLDNFLIFGDVYRRDEIDSTHYPVFHQSDAVRLLNKEQLSSLAGSELEIFERKPSPKETSDRQPEHTLEATKVMEHHLKSTLVGLAQRIFGKDVVYKWVEVYFPFTHPSWELEVEHQGKWMEVLGCGIMRNAIVNTAGAGDRIGWAFGIGLERIAMRLYDIPDIRLFWSNDTGFLSQFDTDDPYKNIKYKPISTYPQCSNDISFWLNSERKYEPNDFFELVREIGGDLVEQVKLVDEFTHPKTGKSSRCYRLVYRHMERTLTQDEVNIIHGKIEKAVENILGVEVR